LWRDVPLLEKPVLGCGGERVGSLREGEGRARRRREEGKKRGMDRKCEFVE
jgi:hypothetical protein